MKKCLLFFIPILVLACRQQKEEEMPNNAHVQISLMGDSLLKAKDAVINDFLSSYNEIQNNLNKIKSREKDVSLSVKGKELQKSKKDQIISDIGFIYDLLNKNRKALSAMNEKLKDSAVKINSLENFIHTLTVQETEQESEVGIMKEQMGFLKAELNNLRVSAEKEQRESDLKSEELSKAYFAIGTYEGLKKEGLITEKGGIIGMGKVTEMNPDLRSALFSSVDKNETTEIPIAAKHIKLIGIHPSDSYKLLDTRLQIKKLVITNPAEFWNTSRYLIIEVSGDNLQSHNANGGLSGTTATRYAL